jgi:ABC-type nitrate/sulfonate/bicarbonate transport system ATPase subunit
VAVADDLRSVPAPAVRIRGVERVFDADGVRVVALAGIDLDVAPGEFVTIIGPSGCGKSTLFAILAGLDEPTAGTVELAGEVTANRLGRCAYMPQRDALLPWRRVVDNVTVGLELAGMSRSEARRRVVPLLDRFGLGAFIRAWPWQLSGGMRSRAAFLRTAVLERDVMLLDEPFGALDGITRAQVQQWLLDVWAEVGSTVVMITHDVPEAVFLSDRVVVMSPRPGRLASVIDIPLPRPRTLEVQESTEFSRLEAAVRESLRSTGAQDEQR